MSMMMCPYCDQLIDTDNDLEHWADDEFEICQKELESLEMIEYGCKRFYYTDGGGENQELVLTEISEGVFDRGAGYYHDFVEALDDHENEKKLDHKFPNR